MNFNVYIDKQTGDRLGRLAKTRRTSRNALIGEALAHLLERGAKADGRRRCSAFREFRRCARSKPRAGGCALRGKTRWLEISSRHLRSE